jgi:hypothetical protein
MASIVGSILPPEKPGHIPNNSQWLSGQGAGTWFAIAKAIDTQYNIKRFTPQGKLDCDRIFELESSPQVFDLNEPYQFTHISHCAKCRILQNDHVFVFNVVLDQNQ